MRYLNRTLPLILLTVLTLLACHSSRKSANATGKTAADSAPASTSICQETVKFRVEKLQEIQSSQSMEAATEIIVYPAAKKITMSVDAPGQGKELFEMSVENSDCTFNADLTTGWALHKGMVLKGETPTKTYIKLEAKEGGSLLFTIGDPDGPNGISGYVTKWEIVNNQ